MTRTLTAFLSIVKPVSESAWPIGWKRAENDLGNGRKSPRLSFSPIVSDGRFFETVAGFVKIDFSNGLPAFNRCGEIALGAFSKGGVL